jgi:hypothetical protein
MPTAPIDPTAPLPATEAEVRLMVADLSFAQQQLLGEVGSSLALAIDQATADQARELGIVERQIYRAIDRLHQMQSDQIGAVQATVDQIEAAQAEVRQVAESTTATTAPATQIPATAPAGCGGSTPAPPLVVPELPPLETFPPFPSVPPPTEPVTTPPSPSPPGPAPAPRAGAEAVWMRVGPDGGLSGPILLASGQSPPDVDSWLQVTIPLTGPERTALGTLLCPTPPESLPPPGALPGEGGGEVSPPPLTGGGLTPLPTYRPLVADLLLCADYPGV